MAEKEENATSGNVEQEVAGGCITEVVLLCTNTVHKACLVQFFLFHTACTVGTLRDTGGPGR